MNALYLGNWCDWSLWSISHFKQNFGGFCWHLITLNLFLIKVDIFGTSQLPPIRFPAGTCLVLFFSIYWAIRLVTWTETSNWYCIPKETVCLFPHSHGSHIRGEDLCIYILFFIIFFFYIFIIIIINIVKTQKVEIIFLYVWCWNGIPMYTNYRSHLW